MSSAMEPLLSVAMDTRGAGCNHASGPTPKIKGYVSSRNDAQHSRIHFRGCFHGACFAGSVAAKNGGKHISRPSRDTCPPSLLKRSGG